MQRARARTDRQPIHVPLTLSIIPTVIVEVGEQRFALPRQAIEEIVTMRGRGPRRPAWPCGDRHRSRPASAARRAWRDAGAHVGAGALAGGPRRPQRHLRARGRSGLRHGGTGRETRCSGGHGGGLLRRSGVARQRPSHAACWTRTASRTGPGCCSSARPRPMTPKPRRRCPPPKPSYFSIWMAVVARWRWR